MFDKIKGIIKGKENPSEYIEIDLEQEKPSTKVVIKTFVLKTYEDVNLILNALREGYTIAVIDIKQLKSKDVVELKRVVSKIKKTVEALEGSIAGFGENVIIATPAFAKVQKGDIDEKKPNFVGNNSDLEKF